MKIPYQLYTKFQFGYQFSYCPGESDAYRCKLSLMLPIDSIGKLHPTLVSIRTLILHEFLSPDWGVHIDGSRVVHRCYASDESWSKLESLLEEATRDILETLESVVSKHIETIKDMPSTRAVSYGLERSENGGVKAQLLF